MTIEILPVHLPREPMSLFHTQCVGQCSCINIIQVLQRACRA